MQQMSLVIATIFACLACSAVAYQCPAGVPLVRCFQQPCATDACKEKCAASGLGSVVCVDNYCGGCKCDCCVPKEMLCNEQTTCCDKKHVCDFSNACILNPLAKCARICQPKSQAASSCKKRLSRCSPGKFQCCQGTACLKQKDGVYRCNKCRAMGESCSTSKPCCSMLKCKTTLGSRNKTCQI